MNAAPKATRRNLLAGITALPLIDASASSAHSDPLVGLYARWLALKTAKVAPNAKQRALRAAFVIQHGEVLENDTAVTGWQADPRKGELSRLCDEVNDLDDRMTEIEDVMLDTPASTFEGVRCKLLVVLDNWSFLDHPNASPNHDGQITVTALRDAVRVLGELAGRAGT